MNFFRVMTTKKSTERHLKLSNTTSAATMTTKSSCQASTKTQTSTNFVPASICLRRASSCRQRQSTTTDDLTYANSPLRILWINHIILPTLPYPPYQATHTLLPSVKTHRVCRESEIESGETTISNHPSPILWTPLAQRNSPKEKEPGIKRPLRNSPWMRIPRIVTIIPMWIPNWEHPPPPQDSGER